MEILLSIIGLYLIVIAFAAALLFILTFVKVRLTRGVDFSYFFNFTISLIVSATIFVIGLGMFIYHNWLAFL